MQFIDGYKNVLCVIDHNKNCVDLMEEARCYAESGFDVKLLCIVHSPPSLFFSLAGWGLTSESIRLLYCILSKERRTAEMFLRNLGKKYNIKYKNQRVMVGSKGEIIHAMIAKLKPIVVIEYKLVIYRIFEWFMSKCCLRSNIIIRQNIKSRKMRIKSQIKYTFLNVSSYRQKVKIWFCAAVKIIFFAFE
jgi:hypothetical protein